jgi:hypothetical protein
MTLQVLTAMTVFRDVSTRLHGATPHNTVTLCLTVSVISASPSYRRYIQSGMTVPGCAHVYGEISTTILSLNVTDIPVVVASEFTPSTQSSYLKITRLKSLLCSIANLVVFINKNYTTSGGRRLK